MGGCGGGGGGGGGGGAWVVNGGCSRWYRCHCLQERVVLLAG